MSITQEDLWKKCTHLECQMCRVRVPNTVQHIGLVVENEDDLDAAYDMIGCCDDPLLEGLIISNTPLFPEDDPESDFNSENYHFGESNYHYPINDNTFEELGIG